MSFERIVNQLLETEGVNKSIWGDMVKLTVDHEEFGRRFEVGKTIPAAAAKDTVATVFTSKEIEYTNGCYKYYNQQNRDLKAEVDKGQITVEQYNEERSKAYSQMMKSVEGLRAAFKNSTYRSCKSVIKSCIEYGIPLVDTNNQAQGKSKLEARIKDYKKARSTTRHDQVISIKKSLTNVLSRAEELVHSDSMRHADLSAVIGDISEILVATRAIDRYLTERLNKYKELQG